MPEGFSNCAVIYRAEQSGISLESLKTYFPTALLQGFHSHVVVQDCGAKLGQRQRENASGADKSRDPGQGRCEIFFGNLGSGDIY